MRARPANLFDDTVTEAIICDGPRCDETIEGETTRDVVKRATARGWEIGPERDLYPDCADRART